MIYTNCNINCQDSIQNLDDSEVKTADCSPVKLSSSKKPCRKPLISLRNLSTACNSLEIDLNELSQNAPQPKEVQQPVEVPKPIVKPAKQYIYSAQDLIDLPVKCDHCERRFKKPESLGGHVSKAHPGKSLIYAKKIERRTEREPDRRLLAEAKEIVLKQYPGLDLIKNRALVTKTKNQLKQMQKRKQICKK